MPIIIRDPSRAGGLVSHLLVESLDLCECSERILPAAPRVADSARGDADPTVASLAGLPFPPDVDGADLSPLFDDPNPVHPPKPNIAFSEYPRCAPPDAPWTPERKCGLKKDQPCASPQSCVNTPRTEFVVMGYRYDCWWRLPNRPPRRGFDSSSAIADA